jgi:ribosomal protein L16/L10AE
MRSRTFGHVRVAGQAHHNRFASFAQVSLNVTTRFQICFSALEAGSSAK